MRPALIVVLLLAAAGGVFLLLHEGDVARERAGRLAHDPGGEDAPARKEKPEEPAKPPVTVRGVVLDEERKPIEGAAVTARVWEAGYRDLDGSARSDALGLFEIGVEKAPWIYLRVRHDDYQATSVSVQRGSDEPVEIVLERGAPVSVLVLTPERKPVAGQKVTSHVERKDRAQGWIWMEPLEDRVTDTLGRARIGAVADATLTFEVDHPAYARISKEVAVSGLDPVEVEIVLDAGGAVEGTVSDPEGKPVEGARVHTTIEGDSRVAVTDAEGRYRLGALLDEVRLMAEKEGFGPGRFGEAIGWGHAVPVKVRSGQTIPGIDIVLGRASWVRGRIVDEKDAPVEGAKVSIHVNSRVEAETDADGRFAAGPFGLAEESTVWFQLASMEFTLPDRKPGRIAPGGDLDLGEIRVRRRAVVRGVVLDEDGRPFRGKANVWGKGTQRSFVEPDGTFELKGLEAGENAISAYAHGETVRRSRPLKLELKAASTVEGVELRLEETLEIRGRVLTPDGKPRRGVDVMAVDPEAKLPLAWGHEGIRASADTDGEGAFRLTGLFPGEHLVGVSEWEKGKRDFVHPPEPRAVAAGTVGVDLVVPLEGGVLEGRVLSKRTGLPLPKFTARFLRFEFFVPQDTEATEIESEDGSFSYELARPGVWAVEIEADGHAELRTKPVALQKGQVVDLGEIRLGDAGVIFGTVRDHRGAPVPFTRVHILNAMMQTNWGAPYTDMDGTFEIAGVSPGTYNLFAVSPRHPLAIVRRIAVAEGARVRVDPEFAASAPLTIRIVDEGGRPVEDAKLIWTFDALRPVDSSMVGGYEPPGYGANESDAEGLIRKPFFPAGGVDLKIEKEGYETIERKVELKLGETADVEIRLERK